MSQASIKTGNRRLLKLAAYIENLPSCQFDLGVITKSHEGGMKDKLVALREMKCGTVACAMGWCPKVFPKLAKWGVNYWDDVEWNVVSKETGKTDFSFAREIFGLNDDVDSAYLLFSPDRYPNGNATTAKEVASRIQEFVSKREKEAKNAKSTP